MSHRVHAKWPLWIIAVITVTFALCIFPFRASAMQPYSNELIGGATSVFAQGFPAYENEPNDSFDTATPIKMNQVVYGKYNYNPDLRGAQDYYKVILPESGLVKIAFANDKYFNDTFGCNFYLHVYNRYYEEVTNLIAEGANTRPKTELIKLSKGVNYIKYRHSDFTNAPNEGHPYHFKLSYQVAKTKITKLSGAKKRMKVQWAKQSNATKYEIRYSTKKSMAKAKMVSASAKSKSKKIKAKSKKKYYVQIRVAKLIGGELYWSDWSGKKSVKMK